MPPYDITKILSIIYSKKQNYQTFLILPTHMFPPPHLKFSMHVIINEEGKRNNLILRTLEILMVMLQQVAVCLENLAIVLLNVNDEVVAANRVFRGYIVKHHV